MNNQCEANHVTEESQTDGYFTHLPTMSAIPSPAAIWETATIPTGDPL